MTISPKAIITAIISVLTIAGALVGAVYFLEDRYVDEKEAVITIQQQQQITDFNLLELWREQKRHLEQERIENPNSPTVKERYDLAKERVKKIEERLFNQ